MMRMPVRTLLGYVEMLREAEEEIREAEKWRGLECERMMWKRYGDEWIRQQAPPGWVRRYYG